MNKIIVAFFAMLSLSSAFAQNYNCTVSVSRNDMYEETVKELPLPIDGFGVMVTVPDEDILDVRLFDEGGDIGLRLASVTGFPNDYAMGSVVEQIRAESLFSKGSQKMKISLRIPKKEGGVNTYYLACELTQSANE